MAWYDYHITKQEGVQGGEPVIAGTRTPVRTIVILFTKTYDGDLEQVQAALPHLSKAQIEAAIEYYSHHRAEIDAHIRRHEQALEVLLAR